MAHMDAEMQSPARQTPVLGLVLIPTCFMIVDWSRWWLRPSVLVCRNQLKPLSLSLHLDTIYLSHLLSISSLFNKCLKIYFEIYSLISFRYYPYHLASQFVSIIGDRAKPTHPIPTAPLQDGSNWQRTEFLYRQRLFSLTI